MQKTTPVILSQKKTVKLYMQTVMRLCRQSKYVQNEAILSHTCSFIISNPRANHRINLLKIHFDNLIQPFLSVSLVSLDNKLNNHCWRHPIVNLIISIDENIRFKIHAKLICKYTAPLLTSQFFFRSFFLDYVHSNRL